MNDETAATQQGVIGMNRRSFLKGAGALPLVAAAAGIGLSSMPAEAELTPIKRSGDGSLIKTSVNAYSFTKLLNAKMKHGGEGMDLYDLVDFAPSTTSTPSTRPDISSPAIPTSCPPTSTSTT